MTVCDVRGRRVRQLWTGMLASGRTLVPWDGRDDRGVAVPSGVYFLRATAGAAADVTRVVRVR
ncbi:MAG: hypothetical protein OEX18_01810 [Candidatus Krumholzibacteria bacterium]|nr:hypothetical protein [Candidatus Krumholzibacteria bacterium]MDH4335995.1 hypothetical protein [Candidatus Krumholzibacteria bacterium]MDH5268429.1 hypothetical protein [Candidatus Krumholzibacteria bacterium]